MTATTKLTPMTEAEFQAQVTQLAEALGYQWAHFRPAQTSRGWRVPVEGPLGAGWPDLVLMGRGRTIFAELKREGAVTKPKIAERQAWVQQWIRLSGGQKCFQWEPADFDEIVKVLQ